MCVNGLTPLYYLFLIRLKQAERSWTRYSIQIKSKKKDKPLTSSLTKTGVETRSIAKARIGKSFYICIAKPVCSILIHIIMHIQYYLNYILGRQMNFRFGDGFTPKDRIILKATRRITRSMAKRSKGISEEKIIHCRTKHGSRTYPTKKTMKEREVKKGKTREARERLKIKLTPRSLYELSNRESNLLVNAQIVGEMNRWQQSNKPVEKMINDEEFKSLHQEAMKRLNHISKCTHWGNFSIKAGENNSTLSSTDCEECDVIITGLKQYHMDHCAYKNCPINECSHQTPNMKREIQLFNSLESKMDVACLNFVSVVNNIPIEANNPWKIFGEIVRLHCSECKVLPSMRESNNPCNLRNCDGCAGIFKALYESHMIECDDDQCNVPCCNEIFKKNMADQRESDSFKVREKVWNKRYGDGWGDE